MKAGDKTRRNYLNRDQRKAQLLEAAATLVDTRGWNGLTMISLAGQAGVSRRLGCGLVPMLPLPNVRFGVGVPGLGRRLPGS